MPVRQVIPDLQAQPAIQDLPVMQGRQVIQDPRDLLAQLAQLETQAHRELLEKRVTRETPDLQGLRVTLAILERAVQRVRQGILGTPDLQAIMEALELQAQRATREIQDQQGRRAFLDLLAILATLVRQVIRDRLEPTETQDEPETRD
jgi:hypothetical protein